MQYNRKEKNVKQEIYAAIFFVNFILAAILAEIAPLLSLVSVAVMAVSLIKGRLWCIETEEKQNEKN